MLEKDQMAQDVPATPTSGTTVSEPTRGDLEMKNSSTLSTSQSSAKNLEPEKPSVSSTTSTSKTISKSSETKESTASSVESKSTTTQALPETRDASFAGNGWLMSIGRNFAGNSGDKDVSLLDRKTSWNFEYLGSDIDAYRISEGDESLRIFWGKLKRVSGNNRNSREAYWKFVRVAGGVKIQNVAYSSDCLSVTYEGYGGQVTFSGWKNLSSQIWNLSKSNYDYAQKIFYVPVNTKKAIDSGNANGGTVWYSNNSKVEEGELLHLTPISDDLSLKEYVAKRGDEEIRRVYVIPVQYNFVNQVNFSKYIDINSPVKSWVLPEELTIPASVLRYNEDTELFEKYRISSINDKAFEGASIKKVTFDDKLDYIRPRAFASSALEAIKNISSGTWLSKEAFTGTHIRDIVTDDPEKFARNTSETVFNNYKNQKMTVWKKGGKQTFTSSYGSEVLSSYNLHEKANLSLSLNVSYPEGTQLRYPLDELTTSFKDAEDCWQSYHTYQWYKDGVKLANQNTPMLKLTSLKAADSGSYYAMVDGQRVEEGKDIKVKVKVDNTNPSSPEPANPDSWINVSLPVNLEFHSASNDYAKIEGKPEKFVNHSGRGVKIVVSSISGQGDFKGIENLSLSALKGSSVDLKNFENGKEVELVTLGNVTSSTNSSLININGSIDTHVKQVSKHRMNLVLKFRPLNQNGKPYS
ncbi:leucine-rich repeat protein [Lactococcus kimchii]|uniref:leucine-rich repeat protein n=1 Tax=Lactococcus sp. S-13 TaxID=2507158 RepID=UPI0016800472|nr:leucine-rich repeat protein [Lactococcus sp. S-13]